MVLIVDDDNDLCDLMKLLFESAGCKALAAHGLPDLEKAHLNFNDFSAGFIDIDLGKEEPDGLDVYQWLTANSFSGKIYFLTGHARNHPKVVEASRYDNVEILSKPVAPKKLQFLAQGQKT